MAVMNVFGFDVLPGKAVEFQDLLGRAVAVAMANGSPPPGLPRTTARRPSRSREGAFRARRPGARADTAPRKRNATAQGRPRHAVSRSEFRRLV